MKSSLNLICQVMSKVCQCSVCLSGFKHKHSSPKQIFLKLFPTTSPLQTSETLKVRFLDLHLQPVLKRRIFLNESDLNYWIHWWFSLANVLKTVVTTPLRMKTIWRWPLKAGKQNFTRPFYKTSSCSFSTKHKYFHLLGQTWTDLARHKKQKLVLRSQNLPSTWSGFL